MGGNSNMRARNARGQCPTDTTEKKYNNKNYCCSHGYDNSLPHTYSTCTQKKYGHKKEATSCKLMGGSQVKKCDCGRKVEKEACSMSINIVY